MALAAALPAAAQEQNFALPPVELERILQTEPLRIVSAAISRPTAQGDITLKAEIAFGDRAPMRIKLRRAEAGANSFNNRPRYDMAAYQLQKLLMDSQEYVVPPTSLRWVPQGELRKFASAARPTFRGSEEVLCVAQYWLQNVDGPADVLDPALLKSDAVYERHVGQLNVLTFLIQHGDSNLGNFLISAERKGARVFAVDNGISFLSEESDRGEAWKSMRVKRLPADAVERLRKLTKPELESRLAVVGQWQLANGRFTPAPLGKSLSSRSGVRRDGATLQMGLTGREIDRVWKQVERLREMIDEQQIAAF
jgi:hypothetical protein